MIKISACRTSPCSRKELHRLAALVGEGAISSEMQKRVGEMIKTFLERAQAKLEGESTVEQEAISSALTCLASTQQIFHFSFHIFIFHPKPDCKADGCAELRSRFA